MRLGQPGRRRQQQDALNHHQYAIIRSGTILRPADVAALADIVRGTHILILSDEVYEHMVYDGVRHDAPPATRNRRREASSCPVFGKT
jgi:methionine aminotransferase